MELLVVIPMWAINLVILILQKTGAVSASEAWIGRRAVAAAKAIEKLRVYTTEQPGDVTPPYPEGRNSGIR